MSYIAPVPITHSSIAGNVPNTADELVTGALAVNVADGALYTKDYMGRIVRMEGDVGNDTLSSAASIDLGAMMAGVVDITGTATVTAVSLRPGQTRTVRFTGALNLTHGASLVLPGGSSITTAAGDMAVFRGFAGGVVRCVSYSFASATAFPAGTAALPSITTRGDPDTGLYFPTANTIGLVTGGTERARINAAGHLGLRATQRIYLDGAAGTGNTYLVESAADTVDLYVGGVKALSITATGLQSPTLVTPALGTPSALVGTNITGTALGFTAGDALKLGGVAASSYSQTSHSHDYSAVFAAISHVHDYSLVYAPLAHAHSHTHTVNVGGTVYTTSSAL